MRGEERRNEGGEGREPRQEKERIGGNIKGKTEKKEGRGCYSKYTAVTVEAQWVPYLLSRLNRCGGRR